MFPVNLPFDLNSYRLQLWEEICRSGSIDDLALLESNFSKVIDVENYWAYPGRDTLDKLRYYLDLAEYDAFYLLGRNLYDSLHKKTYLAQEFVPFYTNLTNLDKPQSNLLASHYTSRERKKTLKPYFEVMIIHPDPSEYEGFYRSSISNYKTLHDDFVYDIIFVDNYIDAIITAISNSNIQCCIYVDNFKIENTGDYDFSRSFSGFVDKVPNFDDSLTSSLMQNIARLRPEVNHYYVSEGFADEHFQEQFDRIIYTQSASFFADMHALILSGLEKRYMTPFFDALRSYAKRPKGSFHALPISQGQSIQSSHWIRDVADFYGEGIFSAETSSTLGGMDSIMDPKGSIFQAQKKASDLFQSKKTYFVTNGTTTANKIVMQANLHPGDIILVSSDCHKSIPYAILLSGATPIFLETYPLNEYDLYGCVTLKRIKHVLLDLKQQGKLHRVKQITLTNSTFDGIIYDVTRYMLDILAIKPDIIFHWDEAWFSFGYFNPLYHGKTAMSAANKLVAMQQDPEYRKRYKMWRSSIDMDNAYMLENDLMPDPDVYKIRVYATHSIHKTLTAFRQASMLHTHDVDFSEDDFYEAYRTHTSTSPNYQIIASLDFSRRQMSLEGYALVNNALRLACKLRAEISASSHLSRYLTVLDDQQLVPGEHCRQEIDGNRLLMLYPELYQCYSKKLFVVDPTRVTIDISATGIDGPNFRQMLMTQYDIQVNKTSHNTLLFIVNIGVDDNNIRYLIESLHHIATKLDNSPSIAGSDRYVANLPLTRLYHRKFISVSSEKRNDFQAVNLRTAYYAGLLQENCIYIPLTTELMKKVMNHFELVSAGFITPYPPGFPIIVPGQLITYDILLYLQNIQIKEIHGFRAEQGLKVFSEDYLEREAS